MTVESSVDFLALLNIFLMYLLVGTFAKYILIKILPTELSKGFNEIALWFRNGIIHSIEGLWPEQRNAEVLFLSRIVAPFAGMLFVESAIMVLVLYLEDYVVILATLWIFRLFVFINVAPTIDDWEMIIERSDDNSKGILIFKLSIIVTLAIEITRWQTDVFIFAPDMLILLGATIFPLSSHKLFVNQTFAS